MNDQHCGAGAVLQHFILSCKIQRLIRGIHTGTNSLFCTCASRNPKEKARTRLSRKRVASSQRTLSTESRRQEEGAFRCCALPLFRRKEQGFRAGPDYVVCLWRVGFVLLMFGFGRVVVNFGVGGSFCFVRVFP